MTASLYYLTDSRREAMAPVLDRIPERWGKYLPGPGWDALLLDLNQTLSALDPEYQILQAKEKFGVLRLYVQFSVLLRDLTSTQEAAYSLIRDAETKSATVCELCGEKGELRPVGWVKTLCDTHAAQEGKA